jgi:hypothetical protein
MVESSHRIILAAGLAFGLAWGIGCAGETDGGRPGPADDGAATGSGAESAEVTGLAPAQEVWWEELRALCGQAYAGALAHGDPSDEAFAGRPMTMHVRRCLEDRIEIPFHVGEDRSRTWVVRRTGSGLELKHDHRHEDGGEDVLTWYGGHTDSAGSELAQLFPADEHSKALFTEQGIPQSAVNVWSVELVPGERFSYLLRRPGRHFQVDFDLTSPVAPPPAPWGHETG